jgi:hypothetical protein
LLLFLLARRRRIENLGPDIGITILAVNDGRASEFHAEAFTAIETADTCARQTTLDFGLVIGSEEQSSTEIEIFAIRDLMTSDSSITTTIEHAILLIVNCDFGNERRHATAATSETAGKSG